MKTNIHLEQCGAGWKILADIEDVTNQAELNKATELVQEAAVFSMALPGWDLKKTAGEENPDGDRWRKAVFARRQWAKGAGR